MESVPKIPLKAKERLEWRGPVPKGKYQATIIGFDEPKESLGRIGLFMLGIRLSLVDDPERICFSFVSGYGNTIMMICRARKYWLGMEVTVDVRVMEHNGQQYNSFDIIWPKES